MKLNRLSSLAFVFVVLSLTALAQNSILEHVSGNVPVQSPHIALSAERPLGLPAIAAQPLAAPAAHNWQLQATLPGAVIHDISFASPLVGYAAAELGQVWKTTNGGQTWTEVLNLGAPYYFYGVQALLDGSIVISGFYDSSTNFEGLIRWSKDGGETWTRDQVVTTTGSVQRVRFTYRNNGLIMDLVGGPSGNIDQVTTDGGFKGSYWTTFVDNPSGGWFGLQYSYLKNYVARASGINFCTSDNGGGEWTCGPSVDSVFDGPVFFLNNSNDGWVGGGEISPNVEGWVHVTTDGGQTWSARTLDGPWPIRELLFLNSTSGWAAGGNVYSGVGGIYFSGNGGQTWSVDVTTNAEMDACTDQPTSTGYQVWCAGYDSSLNGVIYSLAVK